MAREVNQKIGFHEVTVAGGVELVDKSGDFSDFYFQVNVKFQDGEQSYGFVSMKDDGAQERARGIFKSIGFDMDKQSVQELIEDPMMLDGGKLRAEVKESTNQKTGATTINIAWFNPIRRKPDNKLVGKIDAALRAAKKSNPNEEL
jgi:hypothetical protein